MMAGLFGLEDEQPAMKTLTPMARHEKLERMVPLETSVQMIAPTQARVGQGITASQDGQGAPN
jgi:hypothetical protein